MNEFKRARGLAIVSGIMFLGYCVFGNWNFFSNIKHYGGQYVVINFLFNIIPLIALGIMLIIGKMHYGLIVPTIMYALYEVVYGVMRMFEYHELVIFNF